MEKGDDGDKEEEELCHTRRAIGPLLFPFASDFTFTAHMTRELGGIKEKSVLP